MKMLLQCCGAIGDSTARNSAYYIIHGRSRHAWRMQPRLELGTGVLSGLWGCHTALYFFSQVESHLKALKVFLKFPFSGHGQSTSIFFLLCGQIWQLFEFFWTAPRLKLKLIKSNSFRSFRQCYKVVEAQKMCLFFFFLFMPYIQFLCREILQSSQVGVFFLLDKLYLDLQIYYIFIIEILIYSFPKSYT